MADQGGFDRVREIVREGVKLIAERLGVDDVDALMVRHYYAPGSGGAALCGVKVPAHTLWLEPLITPKGTDIELSASVQCRTCATLAVAAAQAMNEARAAQEGQLRDVAKSVLTALQK